MTHAEFEERFAGDHRMFCAWGDLVTSTIVNGLTPDVGVTDLKHFVKITPEARVKDKVSLLAKAFYRKKKYTDPYEQITDKVGTRFVVLLTSDVDIVSNVVEGIAGWASSLDRDFEAERKANPTVFEYQSRHYVVRPTDNIEVPPGRDDPDSGTITIRAGTPCEVQIRSLLQHAYSELTHDTIYKPAVEPATHIGREIAKSMALIETVDDIFVNVMKTILSAVEPIDSRLLDLSALYSKLVGAPLETDEQANIYVLDEITNHAIDRIDVNDVAAWVEEHKFIIERIRDNYPVRFWSRQPAVLYLYYSADKRRDSTKARWPFDEDELRSMYTRSWPKLRLGDLPGSLLALVPTCRWALDSNPAR